MTTAQEIEDWRVKIKKKIWSEFAAEPNEAHGKFLMKKFDELCDTALFGISINSQTTEGTDALEDEYFEAATKPDINIMIDVMRRALVLCRTYEQRMKVVEAETVERCSYLADEAHHKAEGGITAGAYIRQQFRALSPKVDQEQRLSIAVAALQSIREYWRCARTMTDACEHNRNAAAEALARIKEEKK